MRESEKGRWCGVNAVHARVAPEEAAVHGDLLAQKPPQLLLGRFLLLLSPKFSLGNPLLADSYLACLVKPMPFGLAQDSASKATFPSRSFNAINLTIFPFALSDISPAHGAWRCPETVFTGTV